MLSALLHKHIASQARDPHKAQSYHHQSGPAVRSPEVFVSLMRSTVWSWTDNEMCGPLTNMWC